MRHYWAFCVAHYREWQSDTPAEDCPWCEVERLRAEVARLKAENSMLWINGSRLSMAAYVVMDLLKQHGKSIVPHLIDTDENPGQRLREAQDAWVKQRVSPDDLSAIRVTLKEAEEIRDEWKARALKAGAEVARLTKAHDEDQSGLREAWSRCNAERVAAHAMLARLAEAGTGYSQQTMDAVVKEREALRRELGAARQELQELRERLLGWAMEKERSGRRPADTGQGQGA